MIWTELKPPFAVIGMGTSGEAAYSLLIAGGVKKTDICTYDSTPGKADYSDHQDLLAKFKPKTLIVSPGVPLSTPWIQGFKSTGQITSELSLSMSILTGEKIVAVTGSVGKSTTVSLLEAGVRSFSGNAFVGGNLGVPLATYAADIVSKKRAAADWVVLELSSYQLENCKNFYCDYSAITFFTANHLERYSDKKSYYDTKATLVNLTKNLCFINSLSPELVAYFQASTNKKIKLCYPQNFNLQGARLLGEHNKQNIALALQLAWACGWPEKCEQAIKNFSGLPHRLENLGYKNNVLFINDSKATTIESVATAVSSLQDYVQAGCRMILLCGGKDKNLPWHLLNAFKKYPALQVVFFGAVADKAKQMSDLPGPIFPHLRPAVEYAKSIATAGDLVLLSPGGTSLDEFKNFEERGNYFKSLL